MPGKPSVFLSSTNVDFRDLRGALRFWLDEVGFDVWLNEYTDFDKPPGANAFEACFESIRGSDFYVLLIGERKGSEYNAVKHVSVTQQEYRTAYDAYLTSGHPVPVIFIRRDVKLRIDNWQRNGGDKPFDEAPFIHSFIKEVTRDAETVQATHGTALFPAANWLHQFNDFRDIADGLQVELLIKTDLQTRRTVQAIERELEFTLEALIHKTQSKIRRGTQQWQSIIDEAKRRGLDIETAPIALEDVEVDLPFPLHWWASGVVRDLPLESDKQPVQLGGKQLEEMSSYLLVGMPAPDQFWLPSLQQAVTSGALYRFDPETRSFADTELSLAAVALLREARSYAGRYNGARELLLAALARLAAAVRQGATHFELTANEAVFAWGMYHSQVNLYRRASSLYAFLRNRRTSPLPDSLLPGTPLGPKMEESIKRERATHDDLRNWSNLTDFWDL